MNQNTKIDQLNQRPYDRPKNMAIDLLNEKKFNQKPYNQPKNSSTI